MNLRSTLALGLVLLVSRAALAESETVRLADGSVFSGELVEKVPNDHVTIKLATGDVRRFEWSALAPTAKAEVAPSNAAGAAQTVQPITIAPQLPPLPPRPAHVRFESDSKGALLMRVDYVPLTNNVGTFTTQRETPVCYAPCAADADANSIYYVTGPYITRSNNFAIPEGSSTLTARTGSSAVTAAGGWMIGIGVLSTIAGAIATPVAFADSKTSQWNGWQYYGVTSLIAGGALILLGIPFLIAGRTHVALGDVDVAHHKVRFVPGGFVF